MIIIEKTEVYTMNRYENLPGTGEYLAYYNPDNRNFKSVDYRLPQSLIDEMQPSFNRMKKLVDDACLLYVKTWRLADERCRDLMQQESTCTLGKNPREDAEYRLEQIKINIKLLEIEERIARISYGQYRKGLDSGLIPDEVSDMMTRALIGYEEIGIPFQEMYIEFVRNKERRIYQEIKKCKHITPAENPDIVMECIKAQQKAYDSSRPMRNIFRIKPFYDGSWAYYGNDVVDRSTFEYVRKHNLDWTMASVKGHGGLHGDSPETFELMKPMIKNEYGL